MVGFVTIIKNFLLNTKSYKNFKNKKYKKAHFIRRWINYFIIKMLNQADSNKVSLISSTKKLPLYNVFVSIFLMLYFLAFSLGGILIFYNSTYFYHYCTWRFSFTDVIGFCNHEYCISNLWEGRLSNIFYQPLFKGAEERCPGLGENLYNTQNASNFMLELLEIIGIFDIVFVVLFIFGVILYRKKIQKDSKIIRWICIQPVGSLLLEFL